MKVGDKVRFLNTTGGGIVKGFQGKDIVIVDDDGFDTPILIRECVVIEPAEEVQVRQSVKTQPETPKVVEITKEEPVVIKETEEGEELTICLAYLPVDVKQLSSTSYECYLVNDSNYFLSYNYMNKEGSNWNSRTVGVVEPNTKIFLEEFEKSDLNNLERVCLQLIAYKKGKSFSLKNPYSAEIRLDTVKFYKLHSFHENDYFNEGAIIYYLLRKDIPQREMNISPEDIRQAMLEKDIPVRQRIQPIKKKETNPIIEVDLHINELIDTTAGLEASDMLEYQLQKFREAIEENKGRKGQKIVFIHGKGNGTLKNAILNELKTRYKNLYYQDASFREYGFGATMVTIR